MYRTALTLRTLFYFTMDGASSGFIAGGMTGGLLIPLVGAMPGAFIGGSVGLMTGIIVGLVVAVSDFGLITSEMDVRAYRRTLVRFLGGVSGGLLGTGAFLVILSALSDSTAMIARSRTPLPSDYQTNIAGHLLLLLVTLLVFVIPAAVCIAASATYHADRVVAPYVAKKNDELHAMRLPNNQRADRKFAVVMLKKSLWVIPISAVIGACLYLYEISRRPGVPVTAGIIAEGAAAGALGTLAVIVMLIILNTQVLRIANRLYFDEYGTHLTLAQYKYRLGIVLGVTTLVYSLVITAVVGAPVTAIIAAYSAREYADWHYGNEDKLKRDFAGKSKLYAADVSPAV